MKKFFSIMLMLLPLTILATACDDDDDDMPNVGARLLSEILNIWL